MNAWGLRWGHSSEELLINIANLFSDEPGKLDSYSKSPQKLYLFVWKPKKKKGNFSTPGREV